MSSSDESFGISLSGEAAATASSSHSVAPPGFHGYDAPAATPAFQELAASSVARSNAVARPTLLQRNRTTVTALCVVAGYIVLALTTRVVMLGIFPVMLGVRANQRKEPLAPLAIIAAGVAVVFALAAISHN